MDLPVTLQTAHSIAIFSIAAVTTLGIIVRPFRWPEAFWALSGAAMLVLCKLISPAAAFAGAARGTDVYLFLTGMMLLAEIARAEGLFDWVAAHATVWAKGSAARLFLLVYAVGTIVTVFLSNDATAVVLTPAVAASVRAARTEKPLPYLYACAFIANAASFVLPISNPANLVVYGKLLPPLSQWVPQFALPSVLSIAATLVILRFTQRRSLQAPLPGVLPLARLSAPGRIAAWSIAATSCMLLAISAAGERLGLPTSIAGFLTAACVLVVARKSPWGLVKQVSWGILPLVAGLFVMVQALDQTGIVAALGRTLHGNAPYAGSIGGAVAGLISNLVNNLPAGLFAGSAVQQAHLPAEAIRGILIGIDLGPNLSVTGSLATLLWLAALRRENIQVSAWQFLKLGCIVMPPALALALLGAR